MVAAHYPLQALLYAVALHRYLRWRLPGYDPDAHLGGVLYLFVRGMSATDPATGPDGGVASRRLVLAAAGRLGRGRERSLRPRGAGVTELADPSTRSTPGWCAAAEGSLRAFNDAGILSTSDVHVALRLARLERRRRRRSSPWGPPSRRAPRAWATSAWTWPPFTPRRTPTRRCRRTSARCRGRHPDVDPPDGGQPDRRGRPSAAPRGDHPVSGPPVGGREPGGDRAASRVRTAAAPGVDTDLLQRGLGELFDDDPDQRMAAATAVLRGCR